MMTSDKSDNNKTIDLSNQSDDIIKNDSLNQFVESNNNNNNINNNNTLNLIKPELQTNKSDNPDKSDNPYKSDKSDKPSNGNNILQSEIMLEQFIDEFFKKEYNNNNMSMPINFDLVIENYDSNGKKETKSISSTEGKITYNDKNIDDLIKSDNNKIIKSKKTKSEINKNFNKFEKSILKSVDYASSIGDIDFLDDWASSEFLPDSYTCESIDRASFNGMIKVLDWWKNANIKYNIELKYTEKAINLASKYDMIESLNWWLNSGLELKYNHNAIDYASSEYKIRILDWWLRKSTKDKLLRFEYSSNSIDNAKLEEQQLLKLVKWWKNAISTNLDSIDKFKYTKKFINYLKLFNYKEVSKYLIETQLISRDDSLKLSLNSDTNNNGSGIMKMFEVLGIPGLSILSNSADGKQSKTNSKYDIDSFPESIQKHIREKEEELNNNMMINSKAKEYIDNLVKIPFGKYKIEKIFSFVGDLINKIYTINLSSPNDKIKKHKLSNESDLIKFFDFVKSLQVNTYNQYLILYEQYLSMRKKYMEYVNKVLEDTIYGHNSTKKQIKSIISQWLAGGFKTGVVIGIQGPPGVGKTTVIKGAISKCLIDFIDYNLDEDKIFVRLLDLETDKVEPRPFCFTSLGGTTNGSTLLGHNITYHGATSGDIVKHLKEAKIMNPIMYFDELDKISNTEHGHEIYSVLTHITDPVQNSHFTDRYFSEVKIDLSKAIIVFSYNDSKKIERILLDRIQEIRLNPLKPKEKLTICHKFIIPEICSQMGYNTDDITISDNELDMIINEYTIEAGVRKLKEKLFEIFRIRHLELIENPNLKLTNKIDGKFITDTFSDYNKITIKKIKNNNIIGFINGMYASTTGLGGITPIQVKQIYSKELFGISITGSVEKVMEESVKVAKTVGWNLLNKEEQENIIETWNSRGLHIHFPDGSTPKDGPSGGTAITCAIYSLLTNKPIKNNVAITGEIDLDGNVTEIGGLDAKLNGSKKAGIKLALIPKENHREFQIVKKNNPELIGKNFKVIEISHVKQALKYIF